MALAVAISIVFALAFAVAVYSLWRAYRRLAVLQSEITRLAHRLERADEELSALLAEVSGSRIIIEIVNPLTLARERSRWGGVWVGVAPRMIRRRVYDTVARQIKDQLTANGVEAHTQVYHPTGS